MTEIPDYLLERSRERRAALGLSSGDADDAATPATTDAAPAAATSAAPAAAVASTPAVPETPPEPEPVAPYIEAAEKRRRMPVWIAPVFLFLPIWAYLYVGSLESPPEEAAGILAEGEEIYELSCAGCHGATGGGGSGPALAGGDVVATFPSAGEHLAWVALGSEGYGAAGDVYGDPDRAGGARTIGGGGNMPAFGAQIPGEELLAVVLYERIEHGGQPTEVAEIADEMIEAGELEIPESFDGLTAVEMAVVIDTIVERAVEDGVVDEVALGS